MLFEMHVFFNVELGLLWQVALRGESLTKNGTFELGLLWQVALQGESLAKNCTFELGLLWQVALRGESLTKNALLKPYRSVKFDFYIGFEVSDLSKLTRAEISCRKH